LAGRQESNPLGRGFGDRRSTGELHPLFGYRTFLQRDRGLRHAMRWYSQMGRRVWPYEIRNFLFDRRLTDGPTVAQFWGAPQHDEEESMSSTRPEAKDWRSGRESNAPEAGLQSAA
jgi:hypothetical protein